MKAREVHKVLRREGSRRKLGGNREGGREGNKTSAIADILSKAYSSSPHSPLLWFPFYVSLSLSPLGKETTVKNGLGTNRLKALI